MLVVLGSSGFPEVPHKEKSHKSPPYKRASPFGAPHGTKGERTVEAGRGTRLADAPNHVRSKETLHVSAPPSFRASPVHPDGPRELASGIDALYLSGLADPSDEILAKLAAAQVRAKAVDEPVEFDAGLDYQLLPHSWGKYTYCLTNQYGQVGIRPSGHLPEVRVQPRAEALHALSPRTMAEFYDDTLRPMLGTIAWTVPRVDLFIDVQGWDLTARMADRFVSRSAQLTTHMDGEVCAGFQFGTRRISARRVGPGIRPRRARQRRRSSVGATRGPSTRRSRRSSRRPSWRCLGSARSALRRSCPTCPSRRTRPAGRRR